MDFSSQLKILCGVRGGDASVWFTDHGEGVPIAEVECCCAPDGFFWDVLLLDPFKQSIILTGDGEAVWYGFYEERT